MLSKSQLKLIKSLNQKKYRSKHNLFIVEGVKTVNEFLQSNFVLHSLFCTQEFSCDLSESKVQILNDNELKKISGLKSPNEVVALFKIKESKDINLSRFILALDEINDPGNLGAIIRLCDWFGIEQIFCSENTVDCYNSKVVQSTMGSLSRVKINYGNIAQFLENSELPIYAAVMNGENVYESKLEKDVILVMGNEANGISNEVVNLVNNKITIPRFGDSQKTESLNVATATAILLNEFKRS